MRQQKQVEKYEMLLPMLYSLLNEMREFSKKKQDGVLNPLKVKMINRILVDIKEVLKSETSVVYLDILDEDLLPQNSDAVVILGQYQAAMNQYRKKYTTQDGYDTYWNTSEEE